MATPKWLQSLRDSQQKKKETLEKLRHAPQVPPAEQPPAAQVVVPPTQPDPEPAPAPAPPNPAKPVVHRSGRAGIFVYRDDDSRPAVVSKALHSLVDLYLHAAEHRSRHIVFTWPSTIKATALVHALATLERWQDGDKLGVRGLAYPTKSNAFHVLNHIHLDRMAVVRHAQRLAEVKAGDNPNVTRSLPGKDTFLFSLSALKPEDRDSYNPTIGELLPHFIAAPAFDGWPPCSKRLLSQITAKLIRRRNAKVLRNETCGPIGDPATAPDAVFALDGRMTEEDIRRALSALAAQGTPDVVLVIATRHVRQDMPGWKGRLARFCIQLEQVFRARQPGVLVLTDESYAAFKLRDELRELNARRDPEKRWANPSDFPIVGIPYSVRPDGLLAQGDPETEAPAPREFDVYVVDADAAKLANKFWRIANAAPGGVEAAKPLVEAARYLTRLTALPCGINHLVTYLSGPEIALRTRSMFDWNWHVAAIRDFDRVGGASEQRGAMLQAVEQGSQLYAKYEQGTPFAHRLAELVATIARSPTKRMAVVCTGPLYRLLADQFLATYRQYPSGIAYEGFRDRVRLLLGSELDDALDELPSGTQFVFAGLNEEALRLLLADNRIPAHAAVLITQRAGQFLRASLRPIVDTFIEFKPFKPRVESLLRQLKDLPDDASVFSTSDFVPPFFRVELSSDVGEGSAADDPHAWLVRLDDGTVLYRREAHKVYVYDPSASQSTDRGFRPCDVGKLQPGDRLFVMSAELREMVEHVLKEAGIPIQSDKTFEAALRSYHDQVQTHLKERFPTGALTDKVRRLRAAMLELNPKLEDELPAEQAMRNWVNLGESPNTPFEQLKPQAPLKEPNFKAFALALGFSELEAAYHWYRVIMAVRNSRRLDGRHVSDIYAFMLLQPESAMVHSNISRHVLKQLFDRARENVATVLIVTPPKDHANEQ